MPKYHRLSTPVDAFEWQPGKGAELTQWLESIGVKVTVSTGDSHRTATFKCRAGLVILTPGDWLTMTRSGAAHVWGAGEFLAGFVPAAPATIPKPAAYAMYARSEEFGDVLLAPYCGSKEWIQRRVMESARNARFIGSFDQRVAELGWWMEPLYRGPEGGRHE